MEIIIDFYKSLDTLNLIIFWGIIIVIILLLIFSFILINKNKKLKTLVDKKNNDQKNAYITDEKELPIKKEIAEKEIVLEDSNTEEKSSIILPSIPEIPKEEKYEQQEKISKPLETEKKFIAEEHVMEYNNDLFSLSNIKKATEQQDKIVNHHTPPKPPIEIPNKPYQRNVLREMSLGQTSPIGITRPIKKEDKKVEMAKDLEESLNIEQKEIFSSQNEPPKVSITDQNKENIVIKKELTNIENSSPRKTEIKNDIQHTNYEKTKNIQSEMKNAGKERIQNAQFERRITNEEKTNYIANEHKNFSNEKSTNHSEEKNLKYFNESRVNQNLEKNNNFNEERKKIKETAIPISEKEKHTSNIDPQTQVLLNSISTPVSTSPKKSSSEKYLEEVSRKLAEAEVPDDIERTDYELEQEENAIISYTELMKKKDSIQTIDEEDAVISIEELMNRSNQKIEEPQPQKEDTKLYNLSEDEENDNFIKELKQFRNDL